jgi:hypothetical protein
MAVRKFGVGVNGAANRFALAHLQNSAKKAEISRKSGFTRDRDAPYFVLAY